MYGTPQKLPPNSILLRPHWQYHVKRCGTRRSRQCADGSVCAEPALHALADTYAACVDQPVQRLFLALSDLLNHQIYGGDAWDAYAHSPADFKIPTFVSIDDQYYDWYESKYGTKLDRTKVLPVQKAIQGHPESGRIWANYIDSILTSPELNFTSTTHDRCIY